MDHNQLEKIGEELRRLGHERREVVEQIMTSAANGESDAKALYGDLEAISGCAIDLLEHQRTMIREELNMPG